MKLFKRRRKNKTDYRQRLALLKSGGIRLVVRRTLNNVHVQAIEYIEDGDKTRLEASASDLKKYGWKGHLANIPATYLTGFLVGLKCLKNGIKEAILDIGLQTSIRGNAIYAAVLGAIDAGLKIPVNREILPSENRIKGLHIADYAKKLKQEKERYGKQFSAYLLKGLEPEKLSEHFEDTKQKISEEFAVKEKGLKKIKENEKSTLAGKGRIKELEK